MAALFAVYMVGCGGDDPDPDPEAAAFVSADPASGDLPSNGSIKVTFDNNPGAVEASAGNVEGSGKSRTIKGPFDVGALSLELTWEHGGDDGHTLSYTVVAADETAPEVKSSSPENDAKNVDPEKVTEDGIEVVFTESVTGDLMLMDGDEDLKWTSETDGDTITLTAIASSPLSNETEYEVAGTVMDGAGNETEVSITFTTKAKE